MLSVVLCMVKRNFALLAALFALLPGVSVAQQAATLQDVVKKAVVSNPEVQARWHAFLASQHEQDVARGGYFPQLDLSSNTGRQNLKQPTLPMTSFTSRGAELTLSQMIYDGFATRNEVAKMAFSKLARYYEVLDASETVALEAGAAYLDVLRRRELLVLAQENLDQHSRLFAQIQQRTRAGVGRRVDLEQAGGRLALANSNLLTEATNLHDVSARYLRIVGELPPDSLLAPQPLERGIPSNVDEVVQLAYQGSPLFNAAVENVRAAQADAKVRQSGFHPQLGLRASKSVSFDDNGVAGRRDGETIELVLNYNLFRGGSDLAQVRQYTERLAQSKEQRDLACRNVRQTVSIAYNDIQSLSSQLGFLDQHQLAIEKAREAYRQQFDIGQRSLLDLLNTENEYFTARRAYVNATYDLMIARMRTLAGMGQLLAALEVGRDGMPSVKELGQDRTEVDPADLCPAVTPPTTTAAAMAPLTTYRPAEMPALPATPPMAAAAVPQPAPAPTPAVVAAPQPDAIEAVKKALAGWADAWMNKDFPRFESYYAKTFTPENGRTRLQWASDRAVHFAKPGNITVAMEDIKVSKPSENTAVAEFHQTYTSSNYRDVSFKRLDWVREGDQWKIQREQMIGKPQQVWIPDLVKKAALKKKGRKHDTECECD